jgi:hypothetical protein
MTNHPPLTLLEEFLLLALDERTRQVYPLDPATLNCATAGAVLMDLTLRNRIDNDLRDMFTVDPTPTGDEILDPILQMMSQAPVLAPHPIGFWLRQIAEEGDVLREKALRRLENRGTFGYPGWGLFWMFGLRRSKATNEQRIQEVRSRLLRVVHGDEVPSPRGIMLTGLVESCGLFRFILDEKEAQSSKARIANISRMDLISQAVAKSIADVGPALVAAPGNE